MYTLPTSSRHLLWALSLLLLGLLMACSTDSDPAKTESQPVQSNTTTRVSVVASRFFSDVELQALTSIKKRFEAGLRTGMENRTVGYAYTQHATRMRMDYFDQSPVTAYYPFNGKFSLSEVSDAVEVLPFITRKCGFVIGDSDEVMNYYCLSLNENYFGYLNELPDPKGVIKAFIDSYQENKSVIPSIRQSFVLSALESLDFDDWDHQLFYLMFQSWTNEELQAYAKVKAQQE